MLNFVSHFPSKEKWSLLFHAKGYGIQHMMPLSIALEMGRLVQEKHMVSLQHIYILQGHWFMQFLLTCILPFLGKEMKEKFVLVNGSLLEVVNSFEKVSHQKLNYRMAARRSGDVEKIYASTEKAKQLLGWQTELSLETALEDAWRWQLKLGSGPGK